MLAIEHAKLREGEERGGGGKKEKEERGEERGGGGGGGGEKDDTVCVCVHILTLLISQSCQPKTH